MDVIWIVLGIALLVVTLVDCFVTVLNYDEPGIFVNRVVRLQWLVLRTVTRPLPQRVRPFALRQVTGILLITTVVWWLLGIVLSFALIYFGSLGMGLIHLDGGAPEGFWAALYLSIGQFSTVGVEDANATAPWVDMATVFQALLSIVMMSLIITFLLNVFGAVQALRDLTARFYCSGVDTRSPIETLEPYFPRGQPRGVDDHVGKILDDLNSYADELRENRTAYYFQSGRSEFSLPFALTMASGVVAGLRWGLPSDADVTEEPKLARLADGLETFRLWLRDAIHFAEAPVAEPVSADAFAAALAAGGSEDLWVGRFVALCADMARLTGDDTAPDPADAYRRYTQWLPFAFRMDELVRQVSIDLDHQSSLAVATASV